MKLGKHESIYYVLVGTGCRIYVVYAKIKRSIKNISKIKKLKE